MADLPHRLTHEKDFAKRIAAILDEHRAEWERGRTVETERDLDEGLLALLLLLFGLGATSAAGELGIGLVIQGGADAWARSNAQPMSRRIMLGISRRLQRARLADLNQNAGLNTIFNQTVESIILPKTWNNFAATEVTRAYTAGGEYTAAIYNIGRIMPQRAGALFTMPTVAPLPGAGDDLVPATPVELPEPALALWHTSRDDRVCPICKPLDGRPREDWQEAFPLGPPAHDVCRCWLDYATEELEHVVSEGDCGANAPGGGGFQPGNTCGKDGGSDKPKQTDSAAFKAWFGDSKVVDENGQPLVVYHGTADIFSEFDLDHPNRKDTGWLGTGVYVTTGADTASSYANLKAGPAPSVIPMYAKVENPYYATLRDKQRLQLISHNKGAEAGRDAADSWTRELKARGYDGVILKFKPSEVGGKLSREMEIVVFSTLGVKSATGNKGTWDGTNPDIREQLEHCGANGPDGKGFQAGNTCAAGGEESASLASGVKNKAVRLKAEQALALAASHGDPVCEVYSHKLNTKAVAVYTASYERIVVGSANSGKSVESWKQQVEIGFWSQDNAILHELGHRYHHKAVGDSYELAKNFQFTPADKAVAASVSRYAATNGLEFVAELYAGARSGKTYGDDVLSLLNRVTLGRVKL